MKSSASVVVKSLIMKVWLYQQVEKILRFETIFHYVTWHMKYTNVYKRQFYVPTMYIRHVVQKGDKSLYNSTLEILYR